MAGLLAQGALHHRPGAGNAAGTVEVSVCSSISACNHVDAAFPTYRGTGGGQLSGLHGRIHLTGTMHIVGGMDEVYQEVEAV